MLMKLFMSKLDKVVLFSWLISSQRLIYQSEDLVHVKGFLIDPLIYFLRGVFSMDLCNRHGGRSRPRLAFSITEGGVVFMGNSKGCCLSGGALLLCCSVWSDVRVESSRSS